VNAGACAANGTAAAPRNNPHVSQRIPAVIPRIRTSQEQLRPLCGLLARVGKPLRLAQRLPEELSQMKYFPDG
jgi:hypothetical protein